MGLHPAEGKTDGTLEQVEAESDEKARTKINLSISPTCYVHVRRCTKAKETWDSLVKAFEDTGLIRRFGLLKELFSLRLQDFGKMDEYVNKVMSLTVELSDIGYPLGDDLTASIMLIGLPRSYEPLIMTLAGSGVKVTSDLVKNKLMHEIRTENEFSDKAVLYSAKPWAPRNNYNSAPKQKKKFVFRCFRCHEEGDKSSECPKRGGSTQKPAGKSWNMFSAMAANIEQRAWLLDSGATATMTRHNDRLQNRSTCAASEVTLANGGVTKSGDIGEVEVRLKGSSSNRMITDVIHVPNLATNLVSVSKLASKGLLWVFGADGAHMYSERDFQVKGEVLATATQKQGLYFLNVETYIVPETILSEKTKDRKGTLDNPKVNLCLSSHLA